MQIEVVDNASDQVDVRAIVEEVGGGRIGYHRQSENVGAFNNFHTCIERARGQWVHLLNDDDLVLPGFYTELRAGLEQHPKAGMGVTGVAFIDDDGHKIGEMPPPCAEPGIVADWLEQMAVMQRQQVAGTVVRRDVYEELGGFLKELRSAADWEMWCRVAARYPVYCTPRQLAAFRIHAGSWSSNVTRRGENARDSRAVIQMVHDYLPADKADALTATGLKHYAMSGVGQARQFLRTGDFDAATAQLREAFLTSDAPEVKAAIGDIVRAIHEPPVMFSRIGEADAYAVSVERWVECLHRNVTANPGDAFWGIVAAHFAQAGNFIGCYFNDRNLRDTYRRRAEIMEAVLESHGYPVDHDFPSRKPGKIRLGILAAHYGPQTETFTTLPFYKHLDRDLFEITLYAVQATGHRMERYCAGHADRFVTLPQGLAQQVGTIRQDDLDLILIGTNVTAVGNAVTFLALHRLARIQINSTSSCVTSGMRNVDYYVSGRTCEPADAQSQYTERLLMVDGPAHCIDRGSEETSTAACSHTREMYGIPADAIVFASGANFFKIIPELETVWLDILARVPNSYLLLYPFNRNWSNAYPEQMLRDRMYATMKARGLAGERLKIVGPTEGRGDVLARLRPADIYLDSFPFSGINSLLDPLEAGVVPVVMIGTSFRSLMAASLMREMHLSELIAGDTREYVDRAAWIAYDGKARKKLSRLMLRMMAGRPKFLDSRWYSAQVQELLLEMVAERETVNEGAKDAQLCAV